MARVLLGCGDGASLGGVPTDSCVHRSAFGLLSCDSDRFSSSTVPGPGPTLETKMRFFQPLIDLRLEHSYSGQKVEKSGISWGIVGFKEQLVPGCDFHPSG